MKTLIFCLFLSVTFPSQAEFSETVLSMVPKGKILESYGREFTIKTPAGTKMKVELYRDGKLKGAKGRNLNKGDELEPGEGLISLSSAARKLQDKGQRPQGDWLLEEDKKYGWVYEFNNTLISAKEGEILKKVNGSAVP